jgi:hypothetical protein
VDKIEFGFHVEVIRGYDEPVVKSFKERTAYIQTVYLHRSSAPYPDSFQIWHDNLQTRLPVGHFLMTDAAFEIEKGAIVVKSYKIRDSMRPISDPRISAAAPLVPAK